MDDVFNTIHHGDCIARMNALPAGCVDLAFADPPFNIGYEYDVYDDRRERDHYLDWSRNWISAVHRVLKPDGTFWLAIGDEYAAELKVMSQEIGFHTRSWVIWYYTFGVNCTQKFTRSHAHIFHFVKDPKRFTFRQNDLANRIPSARQLVYNDARANPLGRLPDDTWILRPQDLAGCFTSSEDTWYFPRVAGTFKERAGFHGCQMPEQLLGRIIRTCSNENDVVLDPFSGSATTVAVAKKLGRQHIAFDLSPEYVKLGLARLENCRRGDPLDGAEEPRASAPATPAMGLKRNTRSKEEVPFVDTAADLSFENGLLAAFAKASDGFSLDRVIADPQLDQTLADECERLGLPGDLASWNRSLFRLRKSGALSVVPTTRRTQFSWEEYDRFIYASEIAVRRLLDEEEASIDDILCDPLLAHRFDDIAASLAPGFSALEYRWGALKLRKEASEARSRGSNIALGTLGRKFSLSELLERKLESGPGIYVVESASGPLYAGQSLQLAERLQRQFDRAVQPLWSKWSELSVRTRRIADHSAANGLSYQSHLIARLQPRFNFPDLAA